MASFNPYATKLTIKLKEGSTTFNKIRSGASAEELLSTGLAINSLQDGQLERFYRTVITEIKS